MSDTIKFTTTFNEKTVDWLLEKYPEATTKQEAVRMAISDARQLREDFPPDTQTNTD